MFDRGKQWIEACLADGWESKKIYPSNKNSESVKMTKAGFMLDIFGDDSLMSGMYAWGPDGLTLALPEDYDWPTIQSAVNICSKCGKIGPTVRLAFANRVCAECREKLKAEYEYPGWDN